MSLSIGIVGLPNVGKSTLFTALTNKGGLAANYPFATIEPNVGIVPVPDPRLDELAKIDHPAKIVPATVEFVDIAGLVAGASQGEGLGNQFLANIRETDAICEVVRYFSDPDVTHVAGKVNPQSDVDTIKTELILADIATIEKAIPRLEKDAKRDKAGVLKLETAKKALAGLNEGHRARTLDLTEDEIAALYDLHLLTMKPMLYVANVDEDAAGGRAGRDRRLRARAHLREGGGRHRRAGRDGPGRGEGVHGGARPVRERPGPPDQRRLPPARPAELLHVRRDRDARLDHTRSARRRRRPPASSTPTSSAASSRPRPPATRTTWRSAARRAAAMPASCARRARSTSSRTATSCTFKFNV